MISIILVDDHQIVREALRLLLESEVDFRVIEETDKGDVALSLIEKHKPDIVIVDLILSGISGLEVARETKRLSQATKVIVLSMYDTESYVVETLRAGVAGYVLKKSSSVELIFAIRQALAGNLFLSPSINERVINSYLERMENSKADNLYETLTRRERDVFHLVISGLSNAEIASRLSLSVRTIEMHRGNMIKKLGLKSKSDLIKYAVKRGYVE